MDFVLDSNIFIFAFDPPQKPSCVSLLALLLENRATFHVHIPRLILTEIRRNLTPLLMQDAMRFAHQLAIPDEDFVVPSKLSAQYEARGLKPADAFIGAYAEWVKADGLISENRHFLSRPSLPMLRSRR